jgi:hypothetical protein
MYIHTYIHTYISQLFDIHTGGGCIRSTSPIYIFNIYVHTYIYVCVCVCVCVLVNSLINTQAVAALEVLVLSSTSSQVLESLNAEGT